MAHTLPFTVPPKAICILRLSAIGDVCHTLAVVRTLQKAWPDSKIVWLIGQLEASLISDIPGIEFIVHDKHSGREGLARLRRALAGHHFDVLLNMQPSLRALRVARCVKAGIHVGFDRARARDFQWLFTSHKIEARGQQHVLDGLFGFAEAVGVHQRHLHWDIPLRPDDLAFAVQHIPAGQRSLLISPCSSQRFRNFRNWPAEHYAAVANHAHDHHGLQVLLTGASSALETSYAERIAALTGDHVTNLVGQTHLKQLLALIARSAAVLAPDSGPVHMATTVGTPVIGLYATSNPLRTGPLDQRWTINRYPDALLADCGKQVHDVKWGRRVRNPAAMELITVAEVNAMLDQVMADPANR